jgi:hypothetical protein
MKKMMVLGLVLISLSALAQRDTLNKKTAIDKAFEKDAIGNYQFSQVFKLDSLKSGQLHKNAKLWFAEFFKSAKDVIQMDDKEAGLIIGKGLSELKGSRYTFYFMLKIEIKEGRYKLSIEQMKIRRPLDLKLDDNNDWTILTKGETLPLESICPNERAKDDYKMLDGLNKAVVWETVYQIKNTLFEKMKKTDDW